MTTAEAEAIVIAHEIDSPEWDRAMEVIHCAAKDIEAQRPREQPSNHAAIERSILP